MLPFAATNGVDHCGVIAIHLDILVHEQFDLFVDRQVHIHLIDYIPSCSLNGVFDSTLLVAIVHVLEGR